MTVLRGEIWLAELNPVRGSEQAGTRPVLVLQTNAINRFTTTVLAVPFTTNLRRASLPSCVQVAADKTRLTKKLGDVSAKTLEEIENCVLFTLGIKI